MDRMPNGESAAKIENLDQTEVTGRMDKDPQGQQNREEMSSPDDPLRHPTA